MGYLFFQTVFGTILDNIFLPHLEYFTNLHVSPCHYKLINIFCVHGYTVFSTVFSWIDVQILTVHSLVASYLDFYFCHSQLCNEQFYMDNNPLVHLHRQISRTTVVWSKDMHIYILNCPSKSLYLFKPVLTVCDCFSTYSHQYWAILILWLSK